MIRRTSTESGERPRTLVGRGRESLLVQYAALSLALPILVLLEASTLFAALVGLVVSVGCCAEVFRRLERHESQRESSRPGERR